MGCFFLANLFSRRVALSQCLGGRSFFMGMYAEHPQVELPTRLAEVLWNSTNNASLSGTPTTEGDTSIHLDMVVLAISKDTFSLSILNSYGSSQAIVVVLAIFCIPQEKLEDFGLVHWNTAHETSQLFGRILHEISLQVMGPAEVAHGVTWLGLAGGELFELRG